MQESDATFLTPRCDYRNETGKHQPDNDCIQDGYREVPSGVPQPILAMFPEEVPSRLIKML